MEIEWIKKVAKSRTKDFEVKIKQLQEEIESLIEVLGVSEERVEP